MKSLKLFTLNLLACIFVNEASILSDISNTNTSVKTNSNVKCNTGQKVYNIDERGLSFKATADDIKDLMDKISISNNKEKKNSFSNTSNNAVSNEKKLSGKNYTKEGTEIAKKKQTNNYKEEEEVKKKKEEPKNKTQDYEKPSVIPEACTKDYYNVENLQNLNDLQSQCSILKGSLIIDDFPDHIVDLGAIKNIEGDFIVRNSPNVVRIDAPQLNNIGHKFEINELTSLTSIYMDALEHVDVLEWKVVPILSTVSFDTGLKKIKEIIISDTSLVDFDIFKNIEDLAVLNINNNRYMESIDSNAKTISRQLSISANARDLVVSFPQIEWANNITIRDVVSADLPTLEFVNNSAEFIDNFFTELKLPNVKSIGGTLGIIENYHLKNVDLEEVSDIFGGLMITNNSEIETINFLPNLQHIGGAIQFDGKFKDTNFPKLKLVKGSVFINTNSNNMNCNKWTAPENGLSIIRGGKIICISGRKQSTVRLSEDGQILNKDESDVAEETQIKENSGNMGILNNKISISWVIGFAIIAVLLTIPY